LIATQQGLLIKPVCPAISLDFFPHFEYRAANSPDSAPRSQLSYFTWCATASAIPISPLLEAA